MEITLKPIAYVKNERNDLSDDYWGNVLSEIKLVDEFTQDAILGMENFSHLEIIYHFHKLDLSKVETGYKYPRGKKEWGKVGIFAQRKKNRPNLIGLTTVELVEVKERKLIVKNFDAINGTPIIDIKPVLKEFLPNGEIKQPEWSEELMKNYWL